MLVKGTLCLSNHNPLVIFHWHMRNTDCTGDGEPHIRRMMTKVFFFSICRNVQRPYITVVTVYDRRTSVPTFFPMLTVEMARDLPISRGHLLNYVIWLKGVNQNIDIQSKHVNHCRHHCSCPWPSPAANSIIIKLRVLIYRGPAFVPCYMIVTIIASGQFLYDCPFWRWLNRIYVSLRYLTTKTWFVIKKHWYTMHA